MYIYIYRERFFFCFIKHHLSILERHDLRQWKGPRSWMKLGGTAASSKGSDSDTPSIH